MKRLIGATLIYTVMYFILFTPRMYKLESRSDPRENWALAKPVLRWIRIPLVYNPQKTSKLDEIVTLAYAPLIAIDSYFNAENYQWKYGRPIPTWTEGFFGPERIPD